MINIETDVPSYAVHTPTTICGFFGPQRFLSNYWPCEVWFDGLKYKSTESAYQAAKIIPEHREFFTTCGAGTSKKAWKLEKFTKIYTPEEWDVARYDVMMAVVFEKFHRHVDLRKKLLLTGDAYLEETNSWSDTYWGVDTKLGGQNNLGQILMMIRKLWSIGPNNL